MATNEIRLVINATDNSSTALKALARNINNLKKGVTSFSTDTGSASTGVSMLNASVGKSPGLLSRMASGAKSALAIFGGFKLISGVFNTITSAMSGAVDRLDTMDLFERKMRILTGSENDAKFALEEMKGATKGTAYGLDTAARAVQNFVTRGMSTQDATKSVETWMDAVAVYGNGTNEALTSVINALGKMRSKGTVEMRNINSMINAGINPVQLYAKATGQAASEVQEQLTAKTLKTEEFLNVVENALRTGANGVANVTGKAKEMATTWQATFDNMQFALRRGWAALIEGASDLLEAFSGTGLKGVFKSFGDNTEALFTGIGNALKNSGATIKAFYEDFKKRHADTINKNVQTIDQLKQSISKLSQETGTTLRENFLNALSPYADSIALSLSNITLNWNRFKEAVAKGVNQIAPQLGQLFGKIFGTGINSVTDLMNAFLEWATLKIPPFFDFLQEKLQWLIDNWDTVKTVSGYLIKSFLAWKIAGGVTSDIAKLALGIKLLKDRIGELKNLGTDVIGKVLGSAKKLMPDINPNMMGEIQPLQNMAKYKKLAQGAKPEIQTTEGLTNILQQENSTASLTWFEQLPQSINKARTGIGSGMKAIKSYFADSFSTTHTLISDFANYISESFRAMLSGIREFVTEGSKLLGNSFLNGLSKFSSGVRSILSTTGEVLSTFGRTMAEGFFELGGSSLDSAMAKVSSFVTGTKDVAVGMPKVGFTGLQDLGAESSMLSGLEGFENLSKNINIGFDSSVFSEIGSGIQYVSDLISGLIQKGLQFGREFFTPIAEGFFELGGTTLDTFVQSITTKVSTVFNWMKEFVVGFFPTLKDIVTGFFSTMFEGFGDLGSSSGILSGLEGFANMGATLFPDFEAGMFSEIAAGIASISSAAMSLITSLATLSVNIANVAAILGLFNPGGVVSEGINSFFENFGEHAMNFGQNAKEMIISMGQEFIKDLPTLVSQGVQLVVALVKGLLIGIPNVLAAGVQIISGLVTSFLQQLPELAYQGLHAIGEFIAGMISAIPDIAAGVWNLIQSLIGFIIENLPLLLVTGVKLVWSLITGLLSMIGQIGQAIFDLVKGGIDWCLNGGLQDAWNGFANTIKEWFRGALENIGMGWLGDWILGGQQETDEASTFLGRTAAEKNIRSSQDVLNGTDHGADLAGCYERGQDQLNAEANKTGTDSAQNYVQGVTDVMTTTDVDTDLISGDAEAMVEGASTAGLDVGNAYTQTATNTINAGSEQVGAAASTVASQLNLTFDSAAVQEQATNFINTVAVVFTEQAPLLYTTMGNIGTGAVNEFIGKINENLQLAYATAIGLLSMFKMGIDEGFNAVRMAINLGIQTLFMSFQLASESFYVYGQNAVMKYAQGFTDSTPLAVQTALNFKVAVLEQLRGISEATYSMGVNAINAFHNGIVVTQGIVVADFANLIQQISATVTSEIAALSAQLLMLVSAMMNAFQQVMSTGLSQVVQLVSQKRNEIEMAFAPAIQSFGKMGAQMITNLAMGIQSKMGEAVNKTSQLVQALKETFEKGLGIHSPSDYMIWIGQMMLLGFMAGLTSTQMVKFVESIIGDMRTSFKNGSFVPDELVDYLGEDTTKVIDYLVRIGDNTIADDINGTMGGEPAIITEAKKYVGYHGQGGLNGSSMFGLRYGNPGAWCVSFVRYCAENVGVPFPATNYVPDVTAWAQANGRWTMTPQPGYAAIFSNRHIELVAGVNGGVIDYIGGNTGNGEVKHRPRSDATGFVALDGGHSMLTLKDAIQQAYFKKFGGNWNGTFSGVFDPAAGSGLLLPSWFQSWTPSAAVAQWAPNVVQVLGMLQQPLSLLKGVLWAINGESGGDPNSTYLGDINVIYGGSKGLLQTITPNFEKWKNPSLANNIYDPTQNIWTCLREMQDTYGGIANLINRKIANGKWSGYAVGTRYVPFDMMAPIHKGEAIIPANVNPYTHSGGDYLGDLVSNMYTSNVDNSAVTNLGDSYLKNITNTMDSSSGDDYLKSVVATIYNTTGDGYLGELVNDMYINSGIEADTSGMTGSTYNNNNQTINIEAPINVTVDGSDGAQQIANNIAEEMHKALTRAIAIGNSR